MRGKQTEPKTSKEEAKDETIESLRKDIEWLNEQRRKDRKKMEWLNRMLKQGIEELKLTYELVLKMIIIEYGIGNSPRELDVEYLKPEKLNKYDTFFATKKVTDEKGEVVGITLSVRPVENTEKDEKNG